MTRSIRGLLLLGIAIGLAGCGRNRAAGPPKAVPVAIDGTLRLKLMSFNARYENPGDLGHRAWRKRVPGVVRMIREESPDVFGVQEALHGQAADLRASLPDYGFFGNGRDDGRRAGEYAAIFHRCDRFEADTTDAGVFWLSDEPETPGSMTWGNAIPRVAAWLRLTDRASGRSFYVFNTHWDHRHQGSREKAAELLAGRIAGRRRSGEPVVLLGDFNAVETNPGMRRLTGPGARMLDTWRLMHPREERRTTLHFWRGSRDGKLKVDHILVSEGARVIASSIRDRDQPMVSDHFPVTAEVEFP